MNGAVNQYNDKSLTDDSLTGLCETSDWCVSFLHVIKGCFSVPHVESKKNYSEALKPCSDTKLIQPDGVGSN